MFKKLFLCAALLCCGSCKASEPAQYGLVVTIDPGESVLVKTSDGKSSTFIRYDYKPVAKGLDLESPEAYCVEYHFMVWVECPACNCYYDAAHHSSCPNAVCPSRMH